MDVLEGGQLGNGIPPDKSISGSVSLHSVAHCDGPQRALGAIPANLELRNVCTGPARRCASPEGHVTTRIAPDWLRRLLASAAVHRGLKPLPSIPCLP